MNDDSKTETPHPITNPGDSIEQAVEYMRSKYPERYEAAQEIGRKTMELKYDLVSGRDEYGDQVYIWHLIEQVKNYGLTESDLTSQEKRKLEDHYGSDWRKILESTKNFEDDKIDFLDKDLRINQQE